MWKRWLELLTMMQLSSMRYKLLLIVNIYCGKYDESNVFTAAVFKEFNNTFLKYIWKVAVSNFVETVEHAGIVHFVAKKIQWILFYGKFSNVFIEKLFSRTTKYHCIWKFLLKGFWEIVLGFLVLAIHSIFCLNLIERSKHFQMHHHLICLELFSYTDLYFFAKGKKDKLKKLSAILIFSGCYK